MKQILIDMAKALVDQPDKVVVNEREEGGTLYLQLSVAPEDMGKVIGKKGRIAHALRLVIKSASSRTGKKTIVDIV